MKQRIILLFAKPFRMTDEKTGEIKTGVSCNFYFDLDFHVIASADGSFGERPGKGSMPLDKWNHVIKAPAFYDAEFEMTVGSDGKPVFKICDVEYVSEFFLPSEKAAHKSAV